MKLISFVFKVIIFIVVMVFLVRMYWAVKDRVSSVNVTCFSYSGHMKIRALAVGKNSEKTKTGRGFLGFDADEGVSISSRDVQYTDDGNYAGSVLLQDGEKGVSLTLMSDDIHGVANFWIDSKGNAIGPHEFPVVCFPHP